MGKDAPDLRGFPDNGDGFHFRSAVWAQKRIDLLYLYQKALPRLIVKNPDTIIDAEAGTSPG